MADTSPRTRADAALVADIGGTNARFGWLDGEPGAIEHVATLRVRSHASVAAAAGHYLEGLQRELGRRYQPPRRGAFAVATAVTGDAVHFTNSGWSFRQSELRAALGLAELGVINDFEALALALPGLRDDQLRPIGAARPDAGTRAVIGPGTGLGVAVAVPTRSGWMALAGEGGHATLAPQDDFESTILAHARRRFEHVSAERLLSGIGLPVLHAAVCETLGHAAPDLDTPGIVAQGLAGDAAARRTLDAFCALLGGFAGNVALTCGARGGVYVGGGIVPRLGEVFFASAFRERFEAKGRLRGYLEAIPTVLITDTLVALAGAAAWLATPRTAAPA